MARCNPCLLLLPLPIVACKRSTSAASTWFTSIIFLFFWLALIAGIDECARGTCADASEIWVFLVFFYVFALWLQFDLFDEEYVSYKERRERFRDAKERARLLEEKERKEFRKKYSFQTMAEDADRVAKARRRSTLLGVELPSMDREKLEEEKIRLETEIELAQSYGEEEKNVLVALWKTDLEKVKKKLYELDESVRDALRGNRKGRVPSGVRGDRVPRFSDVV